MELALISELRARIRIPMTVPMATVATATFSILGAQVIVDRERAYTVAGGRFRPTTSVNFEDTDVTLSIAGDVALHLALPPGCVKRIWSGIYSAVISCAVWKAEVLFHSLSGGDWIFAAAIDGFAPESASVTVTLTIGNENGEALVSPYAI
jgi:hypothetical protein